MKAIHFKVKARDNLPNKMHFEVQRRTRMAIFKNRKKYSRKQKHQDENF